MFVYCRSNSFNYIYNNFFLLCAYLFFVYLQNSLKIILFNMFGNLASIIRESSIAGIKIEKERKKERKKG